jgi:hypothetical protein
MKRKLLSVAVSTCLLCFAPHSVADAAEPDDVGSLVQAVNGVGPQGAGHRQAIEACSRLSRADAAQIPRILAGMDASGKLAENWLRVVIEAIAQRELEQGKTLPQDELEAFLADAAHSPHARRLAYELILQIDPSAASRLVPGMLNDPSLELRRDGVAYALEAARKLLDEGDREQAVAAYRRTLTAARDLDQVNTAADQLRAAGETVDLPRHFGFLIRWKLVGPFDNKDTAGFDVAYEPEQNPDPSETYQGQTGQVEWFDHTTDDPYGTVDLNEAMGRYKGAIAYAYAEFISDRERPAEFRLGCINGNKVWVNGQLLTENHVYHTGTYMDQYIGKATLRRGKNVILLKIAQNEQTESWAQRWQFQFRVCDQYGTAILSEDR